MFTTNKAWCRGLHTDGQPEEGFNVHGMTCLTALQEKICLNTVIVLHLSVLPAAKVAQAFQSDSKSD